VVVRFSGRVGRLGGGLFHKLKSEPILRPAPDAGANP
jgi:hypothetical protein